MTSKAVHIASHPASHVPKGTPEMPSRVKSLIGARFGRLLVRYYAGMDKHGKSMWCCLCDCGAVCRVPGTRLLGTSGRERHGHPQVSCGCAKADPAIRKAAWLKMPRAKRAKCDKRCAAMHKKVKNRKPAYSMDAHRAAELLGVTLERIEVLASDGLIGSTFRKGALWVSSGDVSSMLATQQRNKRRCRVMDAMMGLGS
jgi:hypothetical protein